MTSGAGAYEQAETYARIATLLAALERHVDEQPPNGSPDYLAGLRDGIRAAINLTGGVADGLRRGRRTRPGSGRTDLLE
jgi:hypothetical protein